MQDAEDMLTALMGLCDENARHRLGTAALHKYLPGVGTAHSGVGKDEPLRLDDNIQCKVSLMFSHITKLCLTVCLSG
jgi:hypothetical protein